MILEIVGKVLKSIEYAQKHTRKKSMKNICFSDINKNLVIIITLQ